MIHLDFTELGDDLDDYEESFKKEYNKWIEKHALDLYKRTLRRTPVDTGTLIEGWEIDFDYVKGWLEVIITNEVTYAEYVEYGTEKMEARLMLTISLDEVGKRMEKEANK